MARIDRRALALGLGGAGALAALGLRPAAALAQPSRPLVAGTDYAIVNPPAPLPPAMAAPGKVEVFEFFWYGCPHCWAFEPVLEPWVAKLPADVRFHRVAYGFDEALRERHQQVYYTWEELGLVDTMHRRTFERFHRQRRPIDTEAGLLAFAGSAGLDVARVKAAWNGPGVQARMREARRFCDDYGVDFVPQLGVQGSFLTAPSMAGDGPKALAATDSLIALVRKGG